MPTTYEIPSDLRAWLDYLKDHKAEVEGLPASLVCGPDTLWVLKTSENLGESGEERGKRKQSVVQLPRGQRTLRY